MAEKKSTKKTAASSKSKKSTAKKTSGKKNEASKKQSRYVESKTDRETAAKKYAEKQQLYAICFIAAGVLMCCFAIIPGINLWASLRGLLFAVFGVGFFLYTFLLFAFGIFAATNKFSKSPMSFVYLSFSLTCLFSSFIHICINSAENNGFKLWWAQLKESASIGWFVSSDGMHLTGGVLGSFFGGGLLHLFGKEAAIATVVILFVVNTMLITGLTLRIIGKSIKDIFVKLSVSSVKRREKRKEEKAERQLQLEEERRINEQERLRLEAERAKRKEEDERRSQELQQRERLEREQAEMRAGEEFIFVPVSTEHATVTPEISLPEIGTVFTSQEEAKADERPVTTGTFNPGFKFTANPYAVNSETEPQRPNPYTHPETVIVPIEDDTDDDTEPMWEEVDTEEDVLPQRVTKTRTKSHKIPPDETETQSEPVIPPRVGYTKPSIQLLNPPKATAEDNTAQIMQTGEKLIDILKSFGVSATLTGYSKGPSVTRYEIQPAAGVKVKKIENLFKDIALGLATSKVIIAPVPNKTSIGIEVPNASRQPVTFYETVVSDKFKKAKSKLNVALGMDIAGNIVCADLAKMPHLLVAGTTGSGKSVCLNCMISSILYNATPSEVKLLMIDPKQVEFSMYNGIPHLLVPVVSNAKKAAGALAWAANEMDNRYEAFAQCGVRDIAGFNQYCKNHPDLGYKPMPQIVIFIDELSDLMMVSPKDVEDYICRIAQKARAAGMHLVVATQRPSVDVITGLIKSNIPSRIALSVSSQIDSRTILDTPGAEKLLGNGDMLFSPVGESDFVRIQGAYLSESEIENIVTFLKSQSEAEYDDEVIHQIDQNTTNEGKKGTSGAHSDDNNDLDPMFTAAMEVVVENGQASTTLLQRRLSLGYARAARVMDQLEQKGVVGPSEGSKPRKVLMTKQQLMELKVAASGNDSE